MVKGIFVCGKDYSIGMNWYLNEGKWKRAPKNRAVNVDVDVVLTARLNAPTLHLPFL